jgi:hypothetical protein
LHGGDGVAQLAEAVFDVVAPLSLQRVVVCAFVSRAAASVAEIGIKKNVVD